MRYMLLLLPVLFLLVSVGVFLPLLNRDSQDLPSALIGKAVLSFDGRDLYESGRVYDKSLFSEGRISLVNVFASWCVPCLAEHPFIRRIGLQTGVQMIGLNWRDDDRGARAFLQKYGNPYDIVVVDVGGRTALDWGVVGVPETYLVDGSGVIRFKHTGPIIESAQVAGILAKIAALRAE